MRESPPRLANRLHRHRPDRARARVSGGGLDKGQEWDWFGSRAIMALVVLTADRSGCRHHLGATPSRAVHQAQADADRSFLVGCIIVSSTYAVLYGSILLLPQMMQSLMRYDATNAGLVLSPAGFFSMLTMILSVSFSSCVSMPGG